MKTVSLLGKITTGSESTILQELKQLEEVVEARLIFGKYDFFAKVKCETAKFEDVLEKIRKLRTINELKILFPRKCE